MVIACRDYLVNKLLEAGCMEQPLTGMKRLETWQSPRVAAVIFDGESFTQGSSAKDYPAGSGGRRRRRKLFSRDATFSVIIGDHEPIKTAELLDSFLLALGSGFYLAGDYVALEPLEAEWVDKDDSILKSQVAVNLKVKFTGGLYKDIGLARLSEVEVVDIRKEGNDG